MRTEELIAQLAGVAEPVRPLPPPWLRAIAWSAVALLSTAAGVAVFGGRSDVAIAVGQPQFVWITAIVLATTAFAVTAALVLAIPGAERSPIQRGSTLVLAGVWALMLAYAIVRAGHGFTGVSDWYVCFIRITGMALVPLVILFGMLRRSAPLRLAWASGLSMMAAAAAGAVAIQFICPLNDPGHALLGHFGPVLVFGSVGAAAARRLLK
jgi:hypothetical protein